MVKLSERAKILVALANGSQMDLARIAGVKPPSVNDWLSGKTQSLKASPAARIATHFGHNLNWVSDGVGPMAPEREYGSQPTTNYGQAAGASYSINAQSCVPPRIQAIINDLLKHSENTALLALVEQVIVSMVGKTAYCSLISGCRAVNSAPDLQIKKPPPGGFFSP